MLKANATPSTPTRLAQFLSGLLLATLAALAPGADTPSAAAAEIDPPGKLKLERVFPRHELSTPTVLDVQTTRDSSILVATSNLGNLGPAGASVAKLTPGLEPDRGFGGDGVVGPAELGARDSQKSSASALLVLDEGRILVAGMTGKRLRSPEQLYVSRLLPDGSLDPAFGDGGVRYLDPTPFREQTRKDALALQPDGGIILGFDVRGPRGAQLGALRLTAGGDIDPAFGVRGARLVPSRLLAPELLRWDIPPYGSDAVYGYDLATDKRGAIAIVATQQISSRKYFQNRPVVVRLGIDGSLPERPRHMIRRTPHRKGIWSTSATTVAFDREDRIVIGGGAVRFPPKGRDRAYFTVHRLTGAGRVDRSFGRRGRAYLRVRPGAYDTGAVDLALPGNRIVLAGRYAGSTAVGYLGSTAVASLFSSGRPDKSFGEGGVFRLVPQEDDATSVAVDAENRVLAAGFGRLTRLRQG